MKALMKGRDWLHLVGGFVLQALLMAKMNYLVALAVVGAVAWGFEILQKVGSMFVPKGQYDVFDVIRTMAGGIVALGLYRLWPDMVECLHSDTMVDVIKCWF